MQVLTIGHFEMATPWTSGMHILINSFGNWKCRKKRKSGKETLETHSEKIIWPTCACGHTIGFDMFFQLFPTGLIWIHVSSQLLQTQATVFQSIPHSFCKCFSNCFPILNFGKFVHNFYWKLEFWKICSYLIERRKKSGKKTSKQSFMQDQESSSCIFWHHWFGPSVAAAGSHVVRSSTYRTRWEVNITSFRFFLVSWGTQNRFRLWHFGTFSLPKEKSQRWKSSTLKVIRKMRWSMFFFLTVNQSFSIGHHTSFCIIFQLIWFVNTFKDRKCHRNAYIVRAWILHLDQQQEIWGVYATCFFHFFQLSPFAWKNPKPTLHGQSATLYGQSTTLHGQSTNSERLRSSREAFFLFSMDFFWKKKRKNRRHKFPQSKFHQSFDETLIVSIKVSSKLWLNFDSAIKV